MASDTEAWVATEGRTVEVLAEASRRLGAARDRDEIYAAACDATLALLAPDRHAGVAVLAWSTDGLSVVRPRACWRSADRPASRSMNCPN